MLKFLKINVITIFLFDRLKSINSEGQSRLYIKWSLSFEFSVISTTQQLMNLHFQNNAVDLS